ncbi:hypothetical protein SOVF_082610 [Spinacia oleracea]|uniref:Ras GTPase-activating protein-binding protein 2-like n=1 Tax=Spinacia oleracea TaxID=3562 RepID=A0A9R0IUU1_SPIOL|nr:nuclear transport factor 2-like [Spinacia oleracea]XP_021854901.1 nuclear transport factor 2-like [Spinacia oleracea]KNA17161.1 hypothetical protein SOVF_082610 [Spinacia oleracea]
MALQTADPPVAPSAQVVANAFVEQYYHILHHSPELVYRFYQDSSVLSRQEENGEMTSVTTMKGINAKIISLDYKNYKAEIKTADAQDSYKDGVIVLVTGCLTGKNNIRRNFAQSFFLAPQSKGFFVLNDVFRYVDESEPLETNVVTIAKVGESVSVPVVSEIEPLHTPDASTTKMATSHEDSQINIEKPTQTFEKERQVVREEVVPTISQSTEHHLSAVAKSSQISPQDDGAKNSYASIVKKAKGSPGPTKVYVPTNTVRSAPSGTQGQVSGSVPTASAIEPSVERKVLEEANDEEEGAAIEGHSVYVRNLPMNVTVTQLEQEFKRFGQIKQEGVQVRSNRQQGSCYGFVEFLSSSSVENAVQAAPIIIGGRQAFAEIKRSGTRVDGGRDRLPFGRGGYRGDSFRGHGGYGGGRGFGGGRGEYSSRGRGQAGRGADGYQRGRGRSGRQSGVNRSNIAP